jgi:hypothetical protein
MLSNLLRTDGASAAPDSGQSIPVTVSHLLTQRVESFCQDFAAAYSADWAGVLELGAAGEVAAGTRAVVEFDERIFAVGKAVLFAGGSVRSVSAVKTDQAGRAQVAFEIDRSFGGGDGTIGIGLPMTPRPLYPGENLGGLQPVVLTLTPPVSESSESFDLLGSITRRAVAPWGVEVSGAWSTINVRERNKARSYRAPNLVRILSIGPCPAPAGIVTVTVDGNLIERLDIDSALLDGAPVDASQIQVKTERVSAELRVDIRTAFEVPADSVLEVLVTPHGHGENPTVPEGIVFARAEFAAAVERARPRRATGRDTFIDVTESGTVELADAAKGTI